VTKRQRAALLREFTTAELQKRERKSIQRQVLDDLLDRLEEKQIRIIYKRLCDSVGRMWVTPMVPAIEAKRSEAA
jgi:hypothetical protein